MRAAAVMAAECQPKPRPNGEWFTECTRSTLANRMQQREARSPSVHVCKGERQWCGAQHMFDDTSDATEVRISYWCALPRCAFPSC